ncbi:hypothetical protein UY3_04251 [Chelonia mydas]|uniref:Uncharacterized protein n=1 Tax=Chelonia mydas TaxID=8469 RepID=M7BRY9_CHEMY|nr:hypothetical protein UY3_04251 [Chelonia mydas]
MATQQQCIGAAVALSEDTTYTDGIVSPIGVGNTAPQEVVAVSDEKSPPIDIALSTPGFSSADELLAHKLKAQAEGELL